jgi:hypothetical protein
MTNHRGRASGWVWTVTEIIVDFFLVFLVHCVIDVLLILKVILTREKKLT